jgi:hypothetical protein
MRSTSVRLVTLSDQRKNLRTSAVLSETMLGSLGATTLGSLGATTLLSLGVAVGLASSASATALSAPAAQSDATAAQAGQSKLQQLQQFLHFVQIARPDAALSQAQVLLDGGLTAAELASIVDENELAERFDRVMTRGRGMEGVQEIAIRFEQLLRDGRLELAREPKRIEESVAMLTGTLRQQMFARERLAAAGEYAMPALLKAVTSGKDVPLEVAATEVIESMRRFAVMPLAAAISKLDPVNQRKVADMLGEIGYPSAAPFLLEVAQDPKTSPDVREAAERALRRIGVSSDSTTAQFTELARRFFEGDESLVSYPTEAVNNVWTYDAFGGLTPTPVPTEIFSEVMAMQMARRALGFDATNGAALALYIASDLRRENRLPDGVVDPIFGGSQYTPAFFAMAAGPSVNSAVLGLALDRKDTELVRDGIASIAQTAGATTLIGAGLVGGSAGRQPLLEALRYPEKRVQYEAALAIGNALPDKTFPGDFSIVPILASAVRDSGTVVGGVVAATEEDRRQLSGRLAGLGLTTLTGASDFPSFEPEIAGSIGLDLLVVAGSMDTVKAGVAAARLANATAAAPILVVVAETDTPTAAAAFDRDPGVVVWPANGSDESFQNAVEAVFTRQSGGRMTDDEALEYTVRSLETLQRIAVSKSGVFSIADAEGPLLDALANRSGGVRLLVADVVAMLPGRTSQVKLVDAALNATDEAEKIELLARAAASARRFGNQVEPRQVDALRGLVAASSGDLAEAAGRLHGALDLSAQETVKLIVK